MSYEMIILDIDGTLINGEKKLTTPVRESLINAQEQGKMVVLASGRPTFGMKEFIEPLKLRQYNSFMLSYNGGEIIDLARDKTLYSKTINRDLALEVIEYFRNIKNINLMAYDNDTVIATGRDEWVELESNMLKMKLVTGDLKDLVTEETPKFICTGEPEYLKELIEVVRKDLGDRLELAISAPFFLEITPKGIDKGKSLGKLFKEIKFDANKAIAVGDGGNDLTMLKSVGLGVAMENARENVKKEADVTLENCNNNHGVMEAVNRFLLNN